MKQTTIKADDNLFSSVKVRNGMDKNNWWHVAKWVTCQANNLTFILLNFLNEIIHLPFLCLTVIIVRNIKSAWMCRLAWLYVGSIRGKLLYKSYFLGGWVLYVTPTLRLYGNLFQLYLRRKTSVAFPCIISGT